MAAQLAVYVVLTPRLLIALGPDVYGAWSVMLAIVSFASVLDFGAGTAIVKYVAQFRAVDTTRSGLAWTVLFGLFSTMCAGVSCALALVCLRGYIVQRLSGPMVTEAEAERALIAIAVALVPMSLLQFARSILSGLVLVQVTGLMGLLHLIGLLGGALLIAGARLGIVAQAQWILCVNTATACAGAAVAWKALRGWRWPCSRPPRGFLSNFLSFSLASWVASIGTALFGSADRILVGMTLGLAPAGIYAIATGVAGKVNLTLSPLAEILTPVTSGFQAEGRHLAVQSGFRLASRVSASWLAGLAGLLVLWMEPILGLWISESFAVEHALFFRILIVCYAIFTLNSPAFHISRGLGFVLLPSVIVVLAGTTTLVLIATLGPRFGLMGVAFANYAYVLTLAVNIYLAIKLKMSVVDGVVSPLGPPLAIFLLLSFASFLWGSNLVAMGLSGIVGGAVLVWMAIGSRAEARFLIRDRRSGVSL